ncbi:MAG: sulfite exporter TauE/SafE family protein [Gammaproteobacteria bacterium]|nr:MAG: sulfite exporter TauE/SafE family protein [Gammaproteobacteria bacterium]
MEISPFLTATIPYLSAFLAGLFGGVHCVGMCGGVSGAMVYGIPTEKRQSTSSLFPFVLNYNLGRILTYTLLGAIIGTIGAQGGNVISAYGGWVWLRVLAGVLMIVMGLYLAGWWMGLNYIERLGSRLVWEKLQNIRKRVLPVNSPGHAILFGLVWGLLPCGLIYTMLIWSLASGGWLQGAGFLFSFGMGTLPVLFMVGLAAGKTGHFLQSTRIRQTAGLIVMVFGGWTVASSLFGHINIGLGCIPPG